MQRIAIILLLFVLLIDAPHPGRELPMPRVEMTIRTRPIWTDLDIASHGYGPLKLLALWQVEGSRDAFGGISSMLVEDNGRFRALNDSGEYFDFAIGQYGVPDHGGALPRFPRERTRPRWMWDSESMARDPRTGRIWVGFEKLQRICRYAPGFARIERCATPRAMHGWPPDGSIESLVRFGDGRFMAIEERTRRADGLHDVLVWAGDPTEPATPAPRLLGYVPPAGYWPTDALWLGGDRLLVLNRRLTLADGFTAKLVMVRMPPLAAGAVLKGSLVADFRRPGPADNLEALALGHGENGPQLWIASDDNHLILQRTLLFQFELPANWVSDRPAP